MLPETFILERPGPGACRFRLAGTRICDMFQTELRGTEFSRLWSPADAALLERELERATRNGAAVVLTFDAHVATSRRVAQYEAILLPLVHVNGNVDRVMGAMTPIFAPFWLGVTPPENITITSNETIWPDGRPSRPKASDDVRDEPQPLRTATRRARIVRANRRKFLVYEGGRSEIN